MKENVISIRLAALSDSAKPRVDVDKVKAQLHQAGLNPYEAKYWKMIDVQPQRN